MNSPYADFQTCFTRCRTAAILGLFALSPSCSERSQQTDIAATPVPVAHPQSLEVTIWDEYVGRFEAVESVEIRPRVSGYLEEVHFEDGALVEEGQLLFTIDPRPFEAALDGAKAQSESAATALRLAQAELDRAKRLLDSRAGSQEEYDQRLQARDAAQASLSAAKASERAADLNVEFTQVRSPVSGRVSRDRVNRGNLVTAQSTLLTTVVSIDPIQFSFTGSERDYLNYSRLSRAGQRQSSRDAPNPVKIKLEDQEDYQIEGRMAFVDNALDPTTGAIEAFALVPNGDGFLTPGMFGRLRLYGRDPFTATLVPDTAVQFDQSRQFVWIVGAEDQAEMRPIELGRLIDGGMRIIEGGLTVDDEIVTAGFGRLRRGVKLAPQRAAIEELDAAIADARDGD